MNPKARMRAAKQLHDSFAKWRQAKGDPDAYLRATWSMLHEKDRESWALLIEFLKETKP